MTLNDIIKYATKNNINFDKSIEIVSSSYDSEDDSTWMSDTQTSIQNLEHDKAFIRRDGTLIDASLRIKLDVAEFM